MLPIRFFALVANFVLLSSIVFGQPGTVYRPDDRRPGHDDDALNRLGIRVYESTHLKLYTDIDAETAAQIPPLVDRCYRAWEDYFGELPPARDGKPFQITGYLMADADLFRRAGLVPIDLPKFLHGRHRGQEFWMYDKPFDYYRRHLILHEATHCFMTIVPQTNSPIWYLEGMAELFGTHRRIAASDETDQDSVEFRVMPEDRNSYGGLGRITLIEQEIAAGRALSFDEVRELRPNDYLENTAYAWSWAACWFLDNHPDYRDRFRSLHAFRRRSDYREQFDRTFADSMDELRTEWRLFVASLEPGFDLIAGKTVLRPTGPLTDSRRGRILAGAGWQSTGIRLDRGETVTIEAEGRAILASEPIPWVTTADGITIRYHAGQPLGRLLAAIDHGDDAGTPITISPVGSSATFTTETAGVLYLRLNDSWGDIENNTGQIVVTISRGSE